MLVRYAFAITTNMEAAQDIVNEALFRVYNASLEFEDAEIFKTYLLRVIWNASIDESRRQQSRALHEKQLIYFQDGIEDPFSDNEIDEQTIKRMYLEIENLPSRSREMIKLLYVEGLKISDVAEKLNLSRSTVATTIYRSIHKLRQKIRTSNLSKERVDISPKPGKVPHKLCLRIRDGKIEVLCEQSDGTWLLSDGTLELTSGLYVFLQSKWSNILNELERLINKANLKEKELQAFFETYPELILDGEYECLIPQATIINDDNRRWNPDFVLIPSDQLSFSKILELKLPNEKISLRSRNGHGDFSKKLLKSINQLKDYHQAFESYQTKQRFKEKYKTDVFKPDLQLVFGRENDIHDHIGFLELQRRSNCNVITWDGLHKRFKRRFC